MIQDSPEWHQWRLSGVGASEVPSILGLCPYGGTPYKVFNVKTGRAKGFEGNAFTEHGKETEAKARARYELLTMEDMPPACATHPEFKYLIASLDGWNQESKRILELKCPKGMSTLEAAENGKVIEHYVPQVQAQLLVAGADDLDFFVYHEDTGRDALVPVKPDLAMQARIVIEVGKFWNEYVLKDIAPPLMPEDVKLISDDGRIKELCEKLIAAKAQLKKSELDTLKADIVTLAGHPKMRCGRVQISTVNRNGKFSFHKLTITEEGA
jgi:putative phage-type endonuclease